MACQLHPFVRRRLAHRDETICGHLRPLPPLLMAPLWINAPDEFKFCRDSCGPYLIAFRYGFLEVCVVKLPLIEIQEIQDSSEARMADQTRQRCNTVLEVIERLEVW